MLDYKFYIAFAPAYAEYEVFPINNALEWANEKDNFMERRTLSTKLVFANDKNGNTFNAFLNHERGLYRCTRIKLRVETTFDNGTTWQTVFNGFIFGIDCDWDISFCQVKCAVRSDDKYTCLTDSWEKELNLAYMPIEPVELINNAGNIETVTCTEAQTLAPGSPLPAFTSNCITSNQAWTEVSSIVTTGDTDVNGFTNYLIVTIWGRMLATSATIPQGNGWVSIGTNQWARPLTTAEIDSVLNSNGNNSIVAYGYPLSWVLQWFGGVENFIRANGVQASAEGAANQCKFLVRSNFFGINPQSGANPTNIAYTAALAKLQQLIIFHKSDVVKANLSGVQLSEPKISLKTLLDELSLIFDVHWSLEPNNGFSDPNNQYLDGSQVLRIEHVSYWTAQKMLNLTVQPQHLKEINGKQQYKYNKTKLPKSEVWTWQVQTDVNSDFDGVPITYDSDCIDKDSKEQSYKSTKFMTNLDYLIRKMPSALSIETSELDGFLLLATYINGTKHEAAIENGYLSNLPKTNAALSWANIQSDYKRFERPAPEGVLNNQLTSFATVKKTRQQTPLEVSLCRSDYFNFFSILHQTKTQFGWGDTEKATYKEPTQTLTVDVVH